MPKVDKRLQRLLSVPSDLTWAELVAVLNALGLAEMAQRRGSYRTFESGAGLKIFLHRPHPGNIVKRYAIREVIEMMDMSTFSHKGYSGSVEVSLEDDCLHGKILHISDLVTYESDTVTGLRSAFESAVDNYIEQCASMGVMPDKPSPGMTAPASISA